MAAPRKHPVDELIRIATEASQLMWRCYDTHIGTVRYDHEWQEKATEIFARCSACEDRLMRLKHLRARALGPKPDGTEAHATDELTHQTGDAEWEVRKFQHLLSCHETSQPCDENWKTRQLRLMSGLRNAMARLVDVSERGNVNGSAA